MPTVTKRVPLDELPAEWQGPFTGSTFVEVRLSSVPEDKAEDQARRSLKEIIDNIPSYPSKGGDVTETIREMREERTNRILGKQ